MDRMGIIQRHAGQRCGRQGRQVTRRPLPQPLRHLAFRDQRRQLPRLGVRQRGIATAGAACGRGCTIAGGAAGVRGCSGVVGTITGGGAT